MKPSSSVEANWHDNFSHALESGRDPRPAHPASSTLSPTPYSSIEPFSPLHGMDGLTHSTIAELSEAFRMLLVCAQAASSFPNISVENNTMVSATVANLKDAHATTLTSANTISGGGAAAAAAGGDLKDASGNFNVTAVQPFSIVGGSSQACSPRSTTTANVPPLGVHSGMGNATVVNALTSEQMGNILQSLGVTHPASLSQTSGAAVAPTTPGTARGRASFKDREESVDTGVTCLLDDEFGGKLSFTEFLVLMLHRLPEQEVDELRSTFQVYDKEGTGTITSQQFVHLFATMGEKSSPEEIEEMMQFADPEDTGIIDYNAFLRKLANVVNH